MPLLRKVRRWPIVGPAYLFLLVATYIWWVLQAPPVRAAVLAASSTDLDHLEHAPWIVLPLSPLLSGHLIGYWAVVVLVCLGGLERVRGPLLTVATGAVAHVVGTLVSEGIVAARIAAGTLSASARHLLDVGPSYVVASCAAAVLVSARAPRLLRVGCALTLVPLIVTAVDRTPAGEVATVGHAVAIAVGVGMSRLRLFTRTDPV